MHLVSVFAVTMLTCTDLVYHYGYILSSQYSSFGIIIQKYALWTSLPRGENR